VLTRSAHGDETRLAVFDAGTGKPLRIIAVPANATGSLAVRGGRAVLAIGRSIRSVDLATGSVRVLAFAKGPIVGVAIAKTRVFWAENDGKRGRIRSLALSR
jgi:hypothetical protein